MLSFLFKYTALYFVKLFLHGIVWGINSVGRVVASHATSQAFESPILHFL